MKIKSNLKTEGMFSRMWKSMTGNIGMYLLSLIIIFIGILVMSTTTNYGTATLIILTGLTLSFLVYDNSLEEAWEMPVAFILFAFFTASFNTNFKNRTINADIKNIVLSESNEKMIVYFNNMKKPMAVVDMSDNITDFYTIKSSLENNLTVKLEITEKETKDVYDIYFYDTSSFKYVFKFKVYQPTLVSDKDTNYQEILSITYMQNNTYTFDKAQF